MTGRLINVISNTHKLTFLVPTEVSTRRFKDELLRFDTIEQFAEENFIGAKLTQPNNTGKWYPKFKSVKL